MPNEKIKAQEQQIEDARFTARKYIARLVQENYNEAAIDAEFGERAGLVKAAIAWAAEALSRGELPIA